MDPNTGSLEFVALEKQRKAEREALRDTWKTDITNCIKRKLLTRTTPSLIEIRDLLNPALAPHIASLYQKLGARCPLTGVRLVCDSGTDKFGQTGVEGEVAIGIARLDVTGRFVPNNVLPVAKGITNPAARAKNLRNLVVFALETKQFIDFCTAHPECSRVQCCERWAAKRWATQDSVLELAHQLGVKPPAVWPPAQNGYRTYFNQLTSDASARLLYDIPTICQLLVAQRGICYMTGVPLWQEEEIMAPSLDRLDNSRGHTTDNVLFSTVWANASRCEAPNPNFFSKMLCDIAVTNPSLTAFANRIKDLTPL